MHGCLLLNTPSRLGLVSMWWSVLFEGIISSVGTEWYDQDGFECDTYSLNTTTFLYGHTCSTHLFKPDSAPEATAGA